MFLRKTQGGCTIAGYEWAEDGAVTEVPDELGADLLRLDPTGYEQVDEPPSTPDTDGEVKKPNQAAPHDEWKAYALAQGVPADVVESATRKAIVAHFHGGPSLTEPELTEEG
jgi:hypothetical protein